MTAILWLIMAWGQAQQVRKEIPEFTGSGYTNGTCYVTPGYNGEKYTIVPCFPSEPPFDVPPLEKKFIQGYKDCEVVPGTDNIAHCQPIYGNSDFVCVDKSRFLLMSEDGKPHCLALGRQP